MSKYAPMKNSKSARISSDRDQELDISRLSNRDKKKERAEERAAKRAIIED